MTTGLIIGRFEPFHKGHFHAVKHALKEVDELIIAVGSSQYVNTADNPFSMEERLEMIENTLAKENIDCAIFPVPDVGEDKKWVEHIKVLVPNFDIVFTGNDFVRKLFKDKGYKVKKVNYLEGMNGTNIRDRILRNQDWRELVPEETAKVIEKVDGVKRIKEIFGKK